jgi:ArsR family transcriptional regulator
MNGLGDTVNLLQLLGDATRVRLLALLADNELTVAELVQITELGQSTVSTHLGKLRESGLLRDRRAGVSTFYAAKNGTMPEEAKRLWELVRGSLTDSLLDADRARCESAIRARAKSAAWPDALAGEMDRHYSPGRTWESLARGMFGLLRLGDVVDIGAGDGSIAQLVAPYAKRVTCVDKSPAMIEAARTRLASHANVRLEVGDAEELPLADASFDDALLFHVLVHVRSPQRAIAEAARVLRKKGRLAIVTLAPHAERSQVTAFGHAHAGIDPAALRKMLKKSGLEVEQCAVTSREKRPPRFEVVTAFATKVQA